VILPPPPAVDPNVLFQKAAVEEIWYDPVGILPRQEAAVAVQELPPPLTPARAQPESPKLPNIRGKRRRRQRFTWESPERYVEDED